VKKVVPIGSRGLKMWSLSSTRTPDFLH
jgi:hypothetical protein